MHPTLDPVAQALGVTVDAVAAYRRQLAHPDFDYRNAATIGVLEAILRRLSGEVHTPQASKHLADAVAVLVARDELAEEEIQRFTYRREDTVDPDFVDPLGVEGHSLGRWAR